VLGRGESRPPAMITDLGAFLALSALLAIIPGPDTAVTVRSALVGGRRAGLVTILGVATGLAVWTLATAGGVAALIEASEPAFVALKVGGACYLALIGVQAVAAALRRHGPLGRPALARRPIAAATAFRQGALTNLGNPKIAVFFTSFLPQFTPGQHTTFGALLLLGVLFCVIGLSWLTIYVLALAWIGDFLRSPRPQRVIEAVTGVVFIGFGIRLALEHR
jgi:threonine/homoserine/homoserine lactone efflux protein